MRSARRGAGSDVAGSRRYRPGDDVDTIDWAASARLSSARGTDEFVVRERFADEAPRVVIVCDRRPEMSAFPQHLPWLSKPEAVRLAALMIADSTVAARGYTGYLDFAEGELYWRPPRSQHQDWRTEERRPFGAPQDTLSRSFRHLLQPSSGHTSYLRLTRREAAARRRVNEERLAELQRAFSRLDLETVVISSHDPAKILEAFVWWADQRLQWRGQR